MADLLLGSKGVGKDGTGDGSGTAGEGATPQLRRTQRNSRRGSIGMPKLQSSQSLADNIFTRMRDMQAGINAKAPPKSPSPSSSSSSSSASSATVKSSSKARKSSSKDKAAAIAEIERAQELAGLRPSSSSSGSRKDAKLEQIMATLGSGPPQRATPQGELSQFLASPAAKKKGGGNKNRPKSPRAGKSKTTKRSL